MTHSAGLLVCAATAEELAAFPGAAGTAAELEPGLDIGAGILAAVTGVGIPETLVRLPPLLDRYRPEAVLNIGLAGVYPGCGEIGQVFVGRAECYGDLGFELPEAPGFRPLREAPFGRQPSSEEIPLHAAGRWVGAAAVRAKGCTVNGCAGTDATGRLRAELFGARFETMEGAAVAQAGLSRGIPVTEIRCICNVAGHRDVRPVNIAQALRRLAEYLRERWEAAGSVRWRS